MEESMLFQGQAGEAGIEGGTVQLDGHWGSGMTAQFDPQSGMQATFASPQAGIEPEMFSSLLQPGQTGMQQADLHSIAQPGLLPDAQSGLAASMQQLGLPMDMKLGLPADMLSNMQAGMQFGMLGMQPAGPQVGIDASMPPFGLDPQSVTAIQPYGSTLPVPPPPQGKNGGGYGPARPSDAAVPAPPRSGPYTDSLSKDSNGNIAGGKLALVLHCKKLQRTSPEIKHQWVEFCDVHGSRVRDPNRHDEQFLIGFLQALDEGGVANFTGDLSTSVVEHHQPASFQPIGGGPATQFMSSPLEGLGLYAQKGQQDTSSLYAPQLGGHEVVMPTSDEKDALVQRVKQLQRSSAEGKQQWLTFCESHGCRRKLDPAAHDETFLHAFFAAVQSGTLPKPSLQQSLDGGTLKAALVARVKELQRTDPVSKQMWSNFCGSHGHRQRDPAVHDEAFLTVFFEALEAGQIPLAPAAPPFGAS